MKFALSILLAFGALAAGCDRVDVSTTSVPPSSGSQNVDESKMAGSPAHAQTLVERIQSSREVTTFQGVRRVEIFLYEGAIQHHSVVREQVSADGHGNYAITALEALEPPMNTHQHATFLALQSLRQGMNWRYRDFAIRDVGLTLQNFHVTDTGVTDVVAGRQVIELRVERVDQSGSIYTLLVDPLNGLVLKSHEESQEGVLLSEMTFESVDLAPDLSGVAWHQPVNNEQHLPIDGSLDSTVHFAVRAPRMLPAGFQLVERSSVMLPQDGSLWVKETYSDGIENLFFLHGGPISNGNGIHSGVPEVQADLIEVTAADPWIVARGNLHSQRVLALGKISEDEILAMLRSAME